MIAIQFPGHGCMDYLTTESGVDLQTMCAWRAWWAWLVSMLIIYVCL